MSGVDRRKGRRGDAAAFSNAVVGLRVLKPKRPGATGIDGAWRYSHPDPQTGKRVQGRLTGTRPEVERQYERLVSDLKAGRTSDWREMPFAELVTRYLAAAEHQWEPEVRRHQTQRCRVLCDDAGLGDAKLGELAHSPKRLRLSLQVLAAQPRGRTGRPFAQSSLRLYRDTLGTVISWGQREEYIPAELQPMKGVSAPQAAVNSKASLLDDDDEGRGKLTPSDIPTMAAAERLGEVWVDRAPGHPWFRYLSVMLAATSGLRWGEQHALRPVDLLLDAEDDVPLISVTRKIKMNGKGSVEGFSAPKGGKSRLALIDPALLDDLRRRADEVRASHGEQGLLFPSPTDPGRPYVPDSFSQSMRRYAPRAGWPVDRDGLLIHTWHSLRHLSCVFLLTDVGVDLEMVSESMGHSRASFTLDRYVGTTDDSRSRAFDRLKKHREQ